MCYLILLLLSSLVGCANCYSEGCFLQGRARGTGDEFMEQGAGSAKNLGTTGLICLVRLRKTT
jgi:hypothetical protein